MGRISGGSDATSGERASNRVKPEKNNVNYVNNEQQIMVNARTEAVVHSFTKKWICIYFNMLGGKFKSVSSDIYFDLVHDLRQTGVKHLISTGRNHLYLINETPDVIHLNVDAIVATERKPVESEKHWFTRAEIPSIGVMRARRKKRKKCRSGLKTNK